MVCHCLPRWEDVNLAYEQAKTTEMFQKTIAKFWPKRQPPWVSHINAYRFQNNRQHENDKWKVK